MSMCACVCYTEECRCCFNVSDVLVLISMVKKNSISNQQSRETVAGTSASITVSSVTILNRTF